MTNRSARDWTILFIGASLSMFGIFLPVGLVLLVVGMALRCEDWFRSRDITISLKGRNRF